MADIVVSIDDDNLEKILKSVRCKSVYITVPPSYSDYIKCIKILSKYSNILRKRNVNIHVYNQDTKKFEQVI